MTTVGTSHRIQATVRNAADALTNPAGLTFVYRAPSGTETTVAFAAMTNPSVGVWYYDTPALTEPGTWTVRVVSTNPTVTWEETFDVDPSAIVGAVDRRGPCQPWCSPADLTRGGWTAPTSLTPSDLLLACAAASEECWEIGGRRWPGICWDSGLPQPCSAGGGTITVLPDGRGGLTSVLSNAGGSSLSRTFHPHGPCVTGTLIDLGQANGTAIDEIRVDAVAVASSAYRLVDRRWVARIDGDEWPSYNPADATTIALAVDFTYGDAPIALGFLAAIALAREIAKGLADEDCAIDPRVTSLVREGISLDLASVDAEGGFVEIPAVRRFQQAVNPHKLGRAAAVIIPGDSTWPSRI